MNTTKEKRPARRTLRLTSDDKWGYVFIAAAMIIFGVFTLYPICNAIYTRFFKYKPISSEFIGFQNYVETLKHSKFNLFYKAAGNTLIYTVIVVPLSLLLSFAIAVMIMPFKKKTQSVFKAMYYLPGIASGVALSVVWLWLYDSSPDGIFIRILGVFCIPAQNWLSSTKTSMLSLIIMALLSSHGVRIITYIAALLGIDNSYFEAAELDGATFFQKVRFIVWPLVKPTTLFLLITGVIGSFQVFMNAYMMTGGGPDNSTTMIGLLIFNNAFTYGKYGLACAQAIILALVIGLLTMLQFKFMGDDIEY